MKLAVILSALLLSACSTCPAPQVITETKYITKLPPAELLLIPAPADKLSNPTQEDIARFIIQEHNRAAQMENQLTGIAAFYKDAP